MSTDPAPRIIDGRYILDEDFRQGGMARVYRAFDRREHRTVAVKILSRELNPDQRLVNTVFDREKRSLERLRHPNIVELYDGGRDPATGEPYFVFEWIERNLREWLRAVPCSGWQEFAGRYAFPILEALAHAHERQVEHRDIKPSNVLVTDDGFPKIADFGISKIQSDIQLGATLRDHSTRPYVPPRGEMSPSRDVYAYAVLVLTEVAGIDPLADAYAADPYAAVSDALEEAKLPERVRDVLASCVSDEPDDRPKSAGALLGALRLAVGDGDKATAAAVTYYLRLTNRARQDIVAALALNEEAQAAPAVEEDLAAGCGIAPQIRSGQVQEGKFEIYGADLRLIVATDEATKDRFVIITAHSLRPSLLEKRRERSYSAPMAFKVGEPPNRAASQAELLDIQVAVFEHADELKQREKADEERRVLWTWKSTLRAKEQLEREREAPLKFTSVEVSGRRVTFNLVEPPADDLFGEARFRQVELRDGGYLGGEIASVSGNEVDLAVRYGDPRRVPTSGLLKVDTSASRTSITRQMVALDALMYDRAARPGLADLLMRPETATPATPVADVDFVNPELDEPKKEAVRKALGSEDFLVVQGPPGTGKTTFIAELVVQFLQRHPDARILISSQTHAALDNVLERLARLELPPRLVRVARQDDPRVSPAVSDLLIDTVVTRWRDEVISRGRDYLRRWAKERGISERDVEIATLYEEAAAAAAQIEILEEERQQLQNELELLERQTDATETRERGGATQVALDAADKRLSALKEDFALLAQRLTKLKAIEAEEVDGLRAHELRLRANAAVDRAHPAFEDCRALVKLLGDWHSRFGRGDEFYGAALLRAQVVAATCLGLQSFKGAEAVEFDLCIIDEASKATATESLVPMIQATRWVLVGDQRQLPPFVEDALLRPELLQEHELSEGDIRDTIFDRLVERLPSGCSTVLSAQHRMVPAIGDLISECFYDGELKSVVSARPPWLAHVLQEPVVWLTTAREPGRFEQPVGLSRSNVLEARVVRRLLKLLNFAAAQKGETLEVGVLSGYLAQLTTIHRQIASEVDSWSNLKVECSSIDSFQGRECDILIYSITRSNRHGQLGFLREERRLNVALSRGRIGLVLVGDHVFARAAGGVGNPLHDVVDYIERNPQACKITEVEL